MTTPPLNSGKNNKLPQLGRRCLFPLLQTQKSPFRYGLQSQNFLGGRQAAPSSPFSPAVRHSHSPPSLRPRAPLRCAASLKVWVRGWWRPGPSCWCAPSGRGCEAPKVEGAAGMSTRGFQCQGLDRAPPDNHSREGDCHQRGQSDPRRLS